MKTNRDWRIESGGATARGALDCGSPLPLWISERGSVSRSAPTTKDVLDSTASPLGAKPLRVADPRSVGFRHGIVENARGLAQSKTWRHFVTVMFLLITAAINSLSLRN